MKEAKNSSCEAWAFNDYLYTAADRTLNGAPHKVTIFFYHLTTYSESKNYCHMLSLSLVCDAAVELWKAQHIF